MFVGKVYVKSTRNFLYLSLSSSSNTYLRVGSTAANTTGESVKIISRLQSLVARHNAGYDVSGASLQYHAADKAGVETAKRHGSMDR